jgi:nitrogen regulatory protein P-II 1
MKKVEAIIEPFDVEEVKANLERIGVRRMTVTEVQGFGRPSGRTEVYRGMRFEPPFAAEAKIEIVVLDEMAAAAIGAIREKAKVNDSGQGDIRVFSLEDTVRLAAAKKSAAAV